MRIVYRLSVEEKIREEMRKAESAGKYISEILLTNAERKDLQQELKDHLVYGGGGVFLSVSDQIDFDTFYYQGIKIGKE